MTSKRIILDLCGGSGSWSKPYRDAGYDVRLITLPDNDVLTYIPPENVYGILSAPPCTMFSLARTNAKTDRDLIEGMSTVRACLNIIWSFMEIRQPTANKKLPLKFWAMENPNGMLKYFLGKPAYQFNPYDFGDMYKKKTFLWGWFNEPIKTHEFSKDVIADLSKFDYMKSKDIHPEYFGKMTRQERRAITPSGFAQAFYKVNND